MRFLLNIQDTKLLILMIFVLVIFTNEVQFVMSHKNIVESDIAETTGIENAVVKAVVKANLNEEIIKRSNVNGTKRDVNPDEEYAGEQTVESLFQEEKHCQILSALGVTLEAISKDKCLKQCLEDDSCQSVSFKNDISQRCNLNTETKNDVGPFYTCLDEASQHWNYYEKTPDYQKTGLKRLTKAGKFLSEKSNIGKMSKKMLLRSRKTFTQVWKAGKESIDNLKSLKKRLLASDEIPNLCKRVKVCKIKPSKDNLDTAKAELEQFSDPQFISDRLEVVKKRYGEKVCETDDYKMWKSQGEKPLDITKDELLELYAIYKYSERPDVNMYSNALFYNVKKLKTKIKEASLEKMNEVVEQAYLMQSYLKKNAITKETTVYRFQPSSYSTERFQPGIEYVETSFMSTTKSNSRNVLGPSATVAERPVEIAIKLKHSGMDISKYSKTASQEEVLVPFGTRFRCISKEVDKSSKPYITRIVIEEV